MSADGPNFLWLIGALVLAVSARTARRPSLGAVLRSLAGWAVVLAIVALARKILIIFWGMLKTHTPFRLSAALPAMTSAVA